MKTFLKTQHRKIQAIKPFTQNHPPTHPQESKTQPNPTCGVVVVGEAAAGGSTMAMHEAPPSLGTKPVSQTWHLVAVVAHWTQLATVHEVAGHVAADEVHVTALTLPVQPKGDKAMLHFAALAVVPVACAWPPQRQELVAPHQPHWPAVLLLTQVAQVVNCPHLAAPSQGGVPHMLPMQLPHEYVPSPLPTA